MRKGTTSQSEAERGVGKLRECVGSVHNIINLQYNPTREVS